ncbi:uncharacterized protein LOC142977205 [Anticarsia gemmatalis]|uniref:uncharacterized protein LOC142977205 n=1 Tax=Anticarsia gemmatalis TaxID=129554 RepID=UPI003F77396B
MLAPWLLLLITSAYCHDTETTTATPNITTLYPTNKTITRNTDDAKSMKNYPQTWKLEAAFAESNLTEVEVKKDEEDKEEKEENEKNEKNLKKEEEMKDFKPSQHLGSFFDEASAEVIKQPISGPIIKRPPSGFVRPNKEEYYYNKIPKEIYQTHKEFPYRFEEATITKEKPTWYEDPMDSRPTVESPLKVPAGGLYKSPGAFKEKPNSDEDFGLDINEEAKEHGLKKRGNPWQHILRLVTAFIPVGLIISALTPSVITIHNVDDKRDPSNVFRRSDHGGVQHSGVESLAPISERCRRRLLCELHSDRYYTSSPSKPSRTTKHCYKIRCEDTEALWRMLRWLFTYNQPEDDQRGRHIT